RVDEGCACSEGQTRSCGTSVGACQPGLQTCDIMGSWGSCVGQVVATTETCNGLDDDCDGAIDDPSSPGLCPCRVVEWLGSGHAYLICNAPTANWDGARTDCPTGYDLAIIDDAAENTFLTAQISGVGGDWWIGLTDAATEGTWLWWDGATPPYSNLGATSASQDCAALNATTGEWNSANCMNALSYICETTL
ncbi:MAG: C-type lectin domain-containing protein, partial [Myxococcales bacterium]|nr:C-type lectin domain-containing protein [Myxococcales bacterium]